MLIHGDPGKQHKSQGYALVSLRRRLQQVMRAKVPTSTSFERVPRAPRKEWLIAQLRQALGRDLPTDPPGPASDDRTARPGVG